MKKSVTLLFVTMAALSAKAQVYAGGTVALWHNDDLDATTFALNPEVGYNLSEKLATGGVSTFAHSKLDERKYNAFAFAPYVRYSYYENKAVRLSIDGGLGFSIQKVKGLDSVNGLGIGSKPGIAIKLNDKLSILAKCGLLGYRNDYMDTESGYGFDFTSEDFSVGFHYEFWFIPNVDTSKGCSTGASLFYHHVTSSTRHTHPEKKKTRRRRSQQVFFCFRWYKRL